MDEEVGGEVVEGQCGRAHTAQTCGGCSEETGVGFFLLLLFVLYFLLGQIFNFPNQTLTPR